MLTKFDKAIQDFVISALALLTVLTGFDLSNLQGVAVAIALALGKAAITWLIPNKA